MKTVHISSTAAVVLLISYCAFAQAAFDMLSVEPNVSGGARGAVQMRSDGISGRNVTLKQLLTYAYEFQEPQISGPEWIEKDGFDIIVKSQDRVGTEQLRLTLQKLLADRFKLSSHRETRYIPGYRLVVAKTGAKLRDSKEEEIFNAALSGRPPFKEGFAAIFTNKDLPGFAGIGRPVTDGTGIKGRYWFQLEWRIDSSRPRMDGSSLHAAIQEQLGLELLEENVPAEVLVIDSVAKR